MNLTRSTIVAAPKAMLHDHLDGGLRPATMVDLAAEFGYDALPSADPAAGPTADLRQHGGRP